MKATSPILRFGWDSHLFIPIDSMHLEDDPHDRNFDGWFDSLKDKQVARRIQVRIDCAEEGNFCDHKSVGEGISEIRIHHGPSF